MGSCSTRLCAPWRKRWLAFWLYGTSEPPVRGKAASRNGLRDAAFRQKRAKRLELSTLSLGTQPRGWARVGPAASNWVNPMALGAGATGPDVPPWDPGGHENGLHFGLHGRSASIEPLPERIEAALDPYLRVEVQCSLPSSQGAGQVTLVFCDLSFEALSQCGILVIKLSGEPL